MPLGLPPLRRAWWASSTSTTSHGPEASTSRIRSRRRARCDEASTIGNAPRECLRTARVLSSGSKNSPPSNRLTRRLIFSLSSSCHWRSTAAGTRSQEALGLARQEQLPDDESSLDGLAESHLVGQEVAPWPCLHRPADESALVRQWLAPRRSPVRRTPPPLARGAWASLQSGRSIGRRRWTVEPPRRLMVSGPRGRVPTGGASPFAHLISSPWTASSQVRTFQPSSGRSRQ